VLGGGSTYAPVAQSRSFPLVVPADLLAFVNRRASQEEGEVIRQFRAWLRQRLVP
jgi:hypothetical protein